MITYRSITLTPRKKYVSYTYNSGKLIQIGTEQLPNKRIVIYFPFCKFILLVGAIFLANLAKYSIDPPLQLTCAVI